MEDALNCSKYLHQLPYYANNLIFIYNLINSTSINCLVISII